MDNATKTQVTSLIKAMLSLAIKSHLWHLGTKSYAQHVALGDLYGYLHDAADEIAEKSMGDGLGMSAPDVPEMVKEIQAICSQLKKIKGDDWLMNLAQEIDGNLYQYIYKLERLK